MNRRQKIIVSVTGIFLVLLLLVGLTYAYFLTRITGNTNNKSISVSTANLALVYGDGNGIISPDKAIMPGDIIDSKTFTVENKGNATTDYVVVIENVNVTYATTVEVDGETQMAGTEAKFESNDFVYTLTCETSGIYEGEEYSGSCDVGITVPASLPMQDDILLGNRIIEGETHTYTLTVTYKETGENQSADMNKTLEAKINIKDIDTINPYSDNTNSLAYNIINNAVALTDEEKSLGYAELVGTPYSKVLYENAETDEHPGYEVPEDIVKSMGVTNQKKYITYSTSYSIDSTGLSLVDPKTCVYNQSNCISDLLAAGEEVYITKELIPQNLTTDGSLKPYTSLDFIFRVTEAPTASTTESINLTIRRIVKKPESVISTTQDEYGTTYYYRGGVTNNYVSFNRMCWRIVRIEGDGSVKLILADSEAECSEETLTKTDSSIIGKGSYAYDGYALNQEYSYDYLPPLQDEYGDGTYDPTAQDKYTTHLKYVYNIFLNGGTIEYTEDGTYKGDGTDVVITKEYAGFSEENLDLLKSEKICIGDRNKTYDTFLDDYAYLTLKRLHEDHYTTLLCDGEYINSAKIYPLTVDEVILAGISTAVPSYNYSHYLRDNTVSKYWLLNYYNNPTGDLSLRNTNYFIANNASSIFSYGKYHEFYGIRPVVSLIPNVELTSGDGSIENPYVIG